LASVITPLPPPHKSKTLETYIEGLAPQLKRITDIAHNNAFLAQQELKARFDKKAATPTFVVGQEVYLDSPHVPAGYSRKLQNRFKRRFVITERKTFTNFCVKDKLTNKELKYPVHCSRFRKVEDDKSTLSHLGPELTFRPLPPISEETTEPPPPEAPDLSHPYESDFLEDYSDLFQDSPVTERPISPDLSISPDANFDLGDMVPQAPPSSGPQSSPPGDYEDTLEDSTELFKSLESTDTPIPSTPPPFTPPLHNQAPTQPTVPEEEIIRILDHTKYNNQDYYQILFKNKDLPKKFLPAHFIPASFIQKYYLEKAKDLPYKKFYPPKMQRLTST